MSFFFPLFSSFRLKFYETTEASKNSPIIRSPIFLPYSPRILNFEIRKSGDDFFWNYHRHGHRFAKKKTNVQNSHPPGRHFSSVSSSPFSKFERYDKNVEKIPLFGTIVVPTIFEIISLFSLFFPFFFFSQIGGRVGDNSKKNHRRFYPPPEVRVSFARDASLEAHIPSPQSSFWSLTSAKGA